MYTPKYTVFITVVRKQDKKQRDSPEFDVWNIDAIPWCDHAISPADTPLATGMLREERTLGTLEQQPYRRTIVSPAIVLVGY